MKVIDLLNKIANGEEVPKKIKYRDWLYEFEKDCNDYLCQYDSLLYRDNDDVKTFLNDEVEIIEEDKPALVREELENRIENALEFLETQYNTYPSGRMWREALKNTLLGKKADNVYEPFEEDKKIERIGANNYKWNYKYDIKTPQAVVDNLELVRQKINEIINYLEENK